MGGSASVELGDVKSKEIIEKKDLPFPKRGVKLCVFEEAINEWGGEMHCEDLRQPMYAISF